jgi:predicted nucleic acid-binding Zn ribbon protein
MTMDLSNIGNGNGQQVKVNVADQPNVECEECGCIHFDKITVIKKISKLLVGTPEDQLVPMETYKCADCGHINKDFMI